VSVRIEVSSTGKCLFLNTDCAAFSSILKDGVKLYLYGEVFYHIKDNGKIKIVSAGDRSYLKKLFSEGRLADIIPCLEGQYIGILIDENRRNTKIFSDRYARMDSFYTYNNKDFYLATDLDFIFQHIRPVYDQKMIANLFSAYGWYTPKGLTIYKNVKQLRVGEIITLSDNGLSSSYIEFKALAIADYDPNDLNTYYNFLRDSIVSRAPKKGRIWVSSSSGWDSSIILGILVDEFGTRNIRMLTGRMKYSDETDVINNFEINKVKKIGAYYGIKPNIVDLDYRSKSAARDWQVTLPFFRSRHNYTYVTHNFATLSRRIAQLDGKGQVVFNGETADSFHNFGFSQFATFFHTKKSFTEFADKMNCYLYGPSFFAKVIKGDYQKDKVFQIFRAMMPNVKFSTGKGKREDVLEGYLFPFLYGSPRVPFAKTYENPVFNKKGHKMLYRFPFREYMPELLSDLSEKNIYSWLCYLYPSFHSQGSTAHVHQNGMELNGHSWRSPFNDYRLISFLSRMPESWGRGLELNNTKYPLKWVAKNKIRFPYELLDVGPHSYLYDVIEGFSLYAEKTYRSGVVGFFKDALSKGSYKEIITDDYFNIEYLDRLTDNYLHNREAKGQEFNNLVSLITLCITGWY